MLKIDLHIHTADDPRDRLVHSSYDLLDRAARLGFHALAITLHEKQLNSPSLTSYARELGITLIPGVERTVEGKHVLLLNFPPKAESARTFEDVARLKSRSRGLVVAPHPFFPGRNCLGRVLTGRRDLFDAVEYSYFHTAWADFNRGAVEWASAHGKPLVGNSDLHDLQQLGRTFSLVDESDTSADAICDAVRRGSVAVRSSPVPLLELTSVFGGMTLRSLLPARRPATGSPRVELAS